MTWGKTHQEKASAEGWGLYWVIDNGQSAKTAKRMILTISDRFKHRQAATAHVITQAKQRSELHLLALQTCAASTTPSRR